MPNDAAIYREALPDVIFIVVARGAFNLRTGGGQRTHMFFEAARKIAPVEVITLGHDLPPAVGELFPGAARVHLVENRAFALKSAHLLPWLASNIGRFLFPSLEYGQDRKLHTAIVEIVDRPGRRLVVFRYTRPFTRSGLVADPASGLFVGVDVDDIEQHKFHTAFAQRFGTTVAARLAGPLFLKRIAALLRRSLERASHIWVSTPEDRAVFRDLPTSVLPNVPFFPAPIQTSAAEAKPEILFVGTFGHRPNPAGVRWFLRAVWPKVVAAVPEARLRIVGLGDWASIRPEFPGLPNVDYVGQVRHVRDEYNRVRLAISPIDEGGGSKIKVIEACSFARPVVCTSHSGRGFGREVESALGIADTPDEFAAACIRYLRDPGHADSTGRRLQDLQKARFSREANEDRIRRDIVTICNAPQAGASARSSDPAPEGADQ